MISDNYNFRAVFIYESTIKIRGHIEPMNIHSDDK